MIKVCVWSARSPKEEYNKTNISHILYDSLTLPKHINNPVKILEIVSQVNQPLKAVKKYFKKTFLSHVIH